MLTTQNFIFQKKQSLLENSFTYERYHFSGWNTTPEGTGETYKDKETIKVSNNMLLYAQWLPESGSLTVTFNANGGKGNMPSQKFETGIPQPLAPNAFLYDMYQFMNWNTSADGKGKIFTNQQIITINSAVTLYAQWKPLYKIYEVAFFSNGGNGSMEKQQFFEGFGQELAKNIFTRPDYVFICWNTRSDDSGKNYRNKEWIVLQDNVRLYAQWTNNIGGGEPCPGIPTVNDIDGNAYKTVQIGAQCWMRENLKTTKFNTGTSIPIVDDEYHWVMDHTAAMCYYDNDASNADIYGALYNGYAVSTGNLCPNGWHVPYDNEWDVLANNLGGADSAGYKMKTVYDWYEHWSYGNGNGSNECGFTAFPAGTRSSHDNYIGMGQQTIFWCFTDNYFDQKIRVLSSWNTKLENTSSGFYTSGFSIRCIKD
jgi:uncharacterized protein (TIGR02145 family)/uncharacterized repeat protein (TIGR02543 family)